MTYPNLHAQAAQEAADVIAEYIYIELFKPTSKLQVNRAGGAQLPDDPLYL